jgi:uncharacterized protein YcfJ
MVNASRIFIIVLVATFSLSAAYANDQRGRSEQPGVHYAYGKVTKVQPIMRTVQVTTPREVCWDESVRQTHYGPGQHRSFTSIVLGGIIGGVVGNQFGSGSGQDAMTVAGAVLGASIGRDAAYRRQAYTQTSYTTERRCEIEEVVHEEQRLEGYQVTYRFEGRHYMTRTTDDPGKRIRLRVQVNPVADY